jgi:hypothetical protein
VTVVRALHQAPARDAPTHPTPHHVLACVLFRYKYLQDGNGGFSNPFNHGIKANCWEAFHPSSTPMAPLMLPRDPESLSMLGMMGGSSGMGSSKSSPDEQHSNGHNHKHQQQHRHGAECRH